ncbi:MAG: aldo/keto reductase [Acidobacteriaceae bacterium]
MPYRPLGKTGEQVSLVGLGGYHIGVQDQVSESIKIIRTALDSGINFLDNCWDYNDGESERRMGAALRDGYRGKAFLMTKIDGRDKVTAAKQIEESLQRLQTDHLDLLQIHEVIRMDDPERVFADDGAIHAALAAKKAGKTRFIGFTGHKSPFIHLHMIKVSQQHGFRFDTVQMPLNLMDVHSNSFEKKVLSVAREKGMGVLAMKPMGGGVILQSHTATPTECLQYAMNLPVSVVITGCDKMEYLEQAINAAKTFHPFSNQELTALSVKTEKFRNAEFEKYKSSTMFDGTHQNPQWLGPDGEKKKQ